MSPDISKIPRTEEIVRTLGQMNRATREEFEAWRQQISDNALESGALEDLSQNINRWAQTASERGDSMEQVAIGTVKGMFLGAFQLGVLCAQGFKEPIQ